MLHVKKIVSIVNQIILNGNSSKKGIDLTVRLTSESKADMVLR